MIVPIDLHKRHTLRRQSHVRAVCEALSRRTDRLSATPCRSYPRINWQSFDGEVSDAVFRNEYRLSRLLFLELLRKLVPVIECEFVIATRSSDGPITPEVMLVMTLRMVCAAKLQDMRRIFRISRASTYVSFHLWKGFYAFILQAGCDFNRIFTFALITCAGSIHDSVAFEISALGRRYVTRLFMDRRRCCVFHWREHGHTISWSKSR